MDVGGRLFAQGGLIKEMWVRVLGLPLHLWSREVIKKIRNVCGRFIVVDEDIARMTNLQWARMLVKFVGKTLPRELYVVIGSTNFSFKLRRKAPPYFSRVMPRSCNNEHGLLEDKDDGVGGTRASSDVGKSLQSLLTRDGDVPCSYERQVIRDATTVEVIAEGGDVGDGNKRVLQLLQMEMFG